jgi:hypothetical protein
MIENANAVKVLVEDQLAMWLDAVFERIRNTTGETGWGSGNVTNRSWCDQSSVKWHWNGVSIRDVRD